MEGGVAELNGLLAASIDAIRGVIGVEPERASMISISGIRNRGGPMDFLKSCISGVCGGSPPVSAEPVSADSTPALHMKPTQQVKGRHPSDEEILQFENELRKEQAANNPLVSPLLPLQVLFDEYETAAFGVKVTQLSKDFNFMRRCRRDGNCFYRAVAFALLEYLKSCPDCLVLKAEWDAKLKAVGFEPIIYEDFSECFWNYTSQENEPQTLESLWDSDEYSSDMAIMYMRLLTAAEMRSNMDAYTAFVDSEDGDFIRWCERNVEAVGVDADQVQMIALSRAIEVPLTIANLGSGECETDLQVSKFDLDSTDSRLLDTITLLYRPGHYDLLYK